MGFCMEDHNDGHGIVLKRKDGSVVLCTETVKSMDFIKEEMPSQLSNAVVPTSFVSSSTHRGLMSTHDSSTPTYHSFMPTSGPKPTISHLQPFGAECYVHIPRPSGSKLLPRALKGMFIGYTDSTKIFQIYIPEKHRIVRSGDVHFPYAPISEGALPPIESSNLQSISPSSAPGRPLPSRPT